MKSRILLFSVFSLSLFAFAVLLTILFNTTPSHPEEIIAFFGSLLFVLFGFITFGFYIFSFYRSKTIPNWSDVLSYVKQSLVLSLGIVLIISLRAYKLINGPSLLILIAGLLIAQFLAKKVSIKSTSS